MARQLDLEHALRRAHRDRDVERRPHREARQSRLAHLHGERARGRARGVDELGLSNGKRGVGHAVMGGDVRVTPAAGAVVVVADEGVAERCAAEHELALVVREVVAAPVVAAVARAVLGRVLALHVVRVRGRAAHGEGAFELDGAPAGSDDVGKHPVLAMRYAGSDLGARQHLAIELD